jgi:hypothetical protein
MLLNNLILFCILASNTTPYSLFRNFNFNMETQVKIQAGISMEDVNTLRHQLDGQLTVANVPFKSVSISGIMDGSVVIPSALLKPDPSEYDIDKSLEDIKKLSSEDLSRHESYRKHYLSKLDEYNKNVELRNQHTLAEKIGLTVLRRFFTTSLQAEVNRHTSLLELWNYAQGFFPRDAQVDIEREAVQADYVFFVQDPDSSRLHPSEIMLKLKAFQDHLKDSMLLISDSRLRFDFFSIVKRHKEYATVVKHVRGLRGPDPLIKGSTTEAKGEATLLLIDLVEHFVEVYQKDQFDSGEVLAAYGGLRKPSKGVNPSTVPPPKPKRPRFDRGLPPGVKKCDYCLVEGHLPRQCQVLQSDLLAGSLHPYHNGPKKGQLPHFKPEAVVQANTAAVVAGFSARIVGNSSAAPAQSSSAVMELLSSSEDESDDESYYDLLCRSQQHSRDLEEQRLAMERENQDLKRQLAASSVTSVVDLKQQSVSTPPVGVESSKAVVSTLAATSTHGDPDASGLATTSYAGSTGGITILAALWFIFRVLLGIFIVLFGFFVVVGPLPASKLYD